MPKCGAVERRAGRHDRVCSNISTSPRRCGRPPSSISSASRWRYEVFAILAGTKRATSRRVLRRQRGLLTLLIRFPRGCRRRSMGSRFLGVAPRGPRSHRRSIRFRAVRSPYLRGGLDEKDSECTHDCSRCRLARACVARPLVTRSPPPRECHAKWADARLASSAAQLVPNLSRRCAPRPPPAGILTGVTQARADATRIPSAAQLSDPSAMQRYAEAQSGSRLDHHDSAASGAYRVRSQRISRP